MISAKCNQIFEQVVSDYHQHNDIFKVYENPFADDTLNNILYAKCWIDTAQWHMEDEIRNPNIEPAEVIKWKRSIDKSNQERTDIVEVIDAYFYGKYKDVITSTSARINTESPAWAIDRLSILALKVYHMQEESTRTDASEYHLLQCSEKLSILLQQQVDLSLAIDELIEDIENGDKYMRVYRQMKMYNDPNLNPVLYNNKK
jgi:Protein of unknown function (DUF4254)